MQKKSKPPIQNTGNSLEVEYAGFSKLAEVWCASLSDQLARALTAITIDLALPVQHRVKPWESLEKKLNSERFSGIDSIRKIQDLLGLRVVLLFKRDVPRVIDVLKANCEIVRIYSVPDESETTRFGYSSIHFIGRLKTEWKQLPTFSGMENTLFEVQVRTLSQHMWAEVSHRLQYKREEDVPAQVRRATNRTAALLEIIDEEYERLLVQRTDYIQSIDIVSTEEPLNVDSLEVLLDAVLPAANKKPGWEEYAALVTQSHELGLKTTSDVRLVLDEHFVKVLDRERRILATDENVPVDGWRYQTERLRREKGVFLNHTGLLRAALEFEFGEKYTVPRSKKILE